MFSGLLPVKNISSPYKKLENNKQNTGIDVFWAFACENISLPYKELENYKQKSGIDVFWGFCL
jgi:hypothetical protein